MGKIFIGGEGGGFRGIVFMYLLSETENNWHWKRDASRETDLSFRVSEEVLFFFLSLTGVLVY